MGGNTHTPETPKPTRFSVATVPAIGRVQDYNVVIMDGDQIIHTIGAHYVNDYESGKKLTEDAHAWLRDNFPDYQNPNSYRTAPALSEAIGEKSVIPSTGDPGMPVEPPTQEPNASPEGGAPNAAA